MTRAAFAARRAEIDALNVFPVPDGDTGTNLYLTLDAALDAMRLERERLGTDTLTTLHEETAGLAEAMLLTARGNSGVILSQLVRGFSESLTMPSSPSGDPGGSGPSGGPGPSGNSGDAGPVEVIAALRRASDLGRASVTRPVEGTILTVAEAAASGAEAAAGGTLAEVCRAATEAAHAALLRTPDQLEALGRAGVVDAGGAGYLLLIESLNRVVEEGSVLQEGGEGLHLPRPSDLAAGTGRLGLTRRAGWGPSEPGSGVLTGGPLGVTGPSHEVMYLLDGTDEDRVRVLRETLDGLGDSLLVVGGPNLFNIHVHVDDIGAAIEAGIGAGRPHRIRVSSLTESPRVGGRSEGSGDDRPALAVVACAAGPGLAELYEDAGAVAVASSRGHRVSATALLEAARATGAPEVIVLPNSVETRQAAAAAADAAGQDGLALHVVRSRAAVQVIAALAVFDPALPVGSNVAAMADAAAGTRHGAVTVATGEGLTSAGVCREGDVLGVVHGDVVSIGTDLLDVAVEVTTRLLSSGGEILTVVRGMGAPSDLAERLEKEARRQQRDLEVVHVDGGQPSYVVLLGVE